MNKSSDDYRILELLHGIGECLYISDEPEKVMDSALKRIADYFGVSHAFISLFNPNTNQLEIEAQIGLPDDCRNWVLPLGVGLTGWVALHNRGVYVDDVRQDPRYVSRMTGLHSAAAVPLINDFTTLGVLSIESETEGAFTAQEIDQLELAANSLVKVLDQIWRIEHLNTRATQLDSVIKTVGKISNRFSLDGILDDITKEARRILDCEMCSLFLLSDDGSLELEVLHGVDGKKTHSETVEIGESSMGTAVLHRKIVEVSDLPSIEEHHFVELKDRDNLVSMLCSPLVYEEEVIGVLNAYTSTPHRFSNSEKQVFGAMADIGAFAIESANLYNRILDSEHRLRHSERLTTLGTLASEIAHEIRNPLTVIRLLVESLSLDITEDDPRYRDFKVIMDNIDNLGEIVGRVLNFGKSQSQMFARWSSSEIVQDCVQLVRFKLKRNRIEVQFLDSEDIELSCNKGQIQQVFLNLFLNAEEAMPEGGSIAIRANHLEQEDKIEFFFSDSGRGIPEDIQDTVFESFLTGTEKGTGLGLAIVKRILRDHRGDIEIVRSSENGTTFRFWLPIHH